MAVSVEQKLLEMPVARLVKIVLAALDIREILPDNRRPALRDEMRIVYGGNAGKGR